MIHTCSEMTAYVDKIGMLPLLNMGIRGWSAEDTVAPECRYVEKENGGWEWSLWKWKGEIIRESGCAYGKFFDRKAAFISKDVWPDFCNYRRSLQPAPEENSIEDVILQTLRTEGSMITRDLRHLCGFNGPKMRGKFDTVIARLQMECYIVTEDFVYPVDKHGHEYGWGLALLTTPETLLGKEACHPDRTPEESFKRLFLRMMQILPDCSEECIKFILR